jgi:hypothetical protein
MQSAPGCLPLSHEPRHAKRALVVLDQHAEGGGEENQPDRACTSASAGGSRAVVASSTRVLGRRATKAETRTRKPAAHCSAVPLWGSVRVGDELPRWGRSVAGAAMSPGPGEHPTQPP